MNPLKAVRSLGFVEGVSLLLLLFVAMPLKYIYGMPEAVRLVGMVHGLLFLTYAALGAMFREDLQWSTKKLALACIIASIPFGPFVFDRTLFPKQAQRA